ncbi:unnamed protein product [Gadus morhua 'NCC']
MRSQEVAAVISMGTSQRRPSTAGDPSSNTKSPESTGSTQTTMSPTSLGTKRAHHPMGKTLWAAKIPDSTPPRIPQCI